MPDAVGVGEIRGGGHTLVSSWEQAAALGLGVGLESAACRNAVLIVLCIWNLHLWNCLLVMFAMLFLHPPPLSLSLSLSLAQSISWYESQF